MGKSGIGLAALAGLLIAFAHPAAAFQETPVTQTELPSPARKNAAASMAPGLHVASPSSDLGTPGLPAPSKSNDIEVFSFGLLPSLDFGLDVMYGSPEEGLKMQQGTGLEKDADVDVGVVGKVRRRF